MVSVSLGNELHGLLHVINKKDGTAMIPNHKTRPQAYMSPNWTTIVTIIDAWKIVGSHGEFIANSYL
jgi:hypothetical protein